MVDAREYAVLAHGGQRYGDGPYQDHLDDVVKILLDYGHTDPELISAGYLHDVLEDTLVSHDDLEKEFGTCVAKLVYAVTDGPGMSRIERKMRPLQEIPRTPGALFVKLADRIANVEFSSRSGSTAMLEMYRNEQSEFERCLRGPISAEPMWDRLRAALGAK